MKPELDAKLRADYPLIFSTERIADPDDSDEPPVPSPFAAWGFECSDGWYDLLDALCMKLQQATKNGAPQVVVSQVKEKFGRLRFYASGPSDEQTGMIELAEAMSARLCERCGNRGTLIQTGWMRTRCPEHANV
ncbi:hypothetical protein AB4Y42_14145 [Paraburkholderia sp. EG286B]|uniref:hypothetical protein n=1 Tax=Paraburkholderia sp. EG286B TaxID=3237011 RepID=UPI0034D34D0C